METELQSSDKVRRGRKRAALPADNRGAVSAVQVHREHRKRQSICARVVRELFGSLAELDPRLWDQAAYLTLVGGVYEQMVTGNGIPLKELAMVSRILEGCRKFGESLGAVRNSLDVSDKEGAPRLPPEEQVRDLYGTNLSPVSSETPQPR